jgi:predicted amidohydrolase
MKITIGLSQMNTGAEKSENLAAAKAAIRDLAGKGAELIMMPEHFNFLGPGRLKQQNAESLEASPTLDMIRREARDLNVHIHLGSFLEKEGAHIYNTGIVVDPHGEIAAKYRKLHLFDVEIPGGRKYLESRTITAGDEVATFSIGNFVFGMATCYDLRFPELFRRLTHLGAHVLLLPAAYTMQTGRDHWEVLLRARAIENLCWVAAAGQWGAIPPDHLCYGRSMVINPWGLVVAQATDDVTTITAELDLESLQDIRTRFPVLDHVREDMFPR